MEITGVRVTLMDPDKAEATGLQAVLSLTFDDCFAVHDVKVIKRHSDGELTVSMPGDVKRLPCPACRGKTSVLANFCPHCGTPLVGLKGQIAPDAETGRRRYHSDTCHPTNPLFRRKIVERCLRAFREEKLLPGTYEPTKPPNGTPRVAAVATRPFGAGVGVFPDDGPS